ncbi:MAG: TolC family protein [Gemmatimonadota bacterium]|nr:MAG: TolC family protein [Gemmatimonadota bacterium]
MNSQRAGRCGLRGSGKWEKGKEGQGTGKRERGRVASVWDVGAAVLVAAVVLAGPAIAQEVPTRLTLDDALRLGREWNPQYRQAVVQADATGADVRAATGAFFPDLRASLGFNGSRSTTSVGEDDFGGAILGQSRTIESSGSSQGLNSSITLFNGLQNFYGLKSSKANSEAARYGVDSEAVTLEAQIKRQFYQVVAALRSIEIEQEILRIRQEDLLTTERLFRVAARDQSDLLGGQATVASQEQQVARALGDYRKALLLLAEAIGFDDAVEFEIDGDFPNAFDPALLDAETLVDYVLRQNPALLQATFNAARADYDASRARGARWPTLSLSGGFTRSASEQGYGGLWNFNPENQYWQAGLNLSWPIFNRFSTSNSIAQAAANQDVQHEQLRQTRLRLEREIRSALIDVDNTHEQLLLAERSAELGLQRVAMTREQYQLGMASFFELQQVVAQSTNDARGALNARLAYTNAVVELERLVGRPVRP